MLSKQPDEETTSFILKLAVYIGGTIAGLAAKLATVNMKKKITFRVGLYHATIAFAAAYFVWFLMDNTGHSKWAAIVAVPVGRFADGVFIFIWEWIKYSLSKASNDINKIN